MDRPTEGFSSIEEAIEDVRRGKVVVVVNVINDRHLYACVAMCDMVAGFVFVFVCRWWLLLMMKIGKTKEI